jgi:hypothetical protein
MHHVTTLALHALPIGRVTNHPVAARECTTRRRFALYALAIGRVITPCPPASAPRGDASLRALPIGRVTNHAVRDQVRPRGRPPAAQDRTQERGCARGHTRRRDLTTAGTPERHQLAGASNHEP